MIHTHTQPHSRYHSISTQEIHALFLAMFTAILIMIISKEHHQRNTEGPRTSLLDIQRSILLQPGHERETGKAFIEWGYAGVVAGILATKAEKSRTNYKHKWTKEWVARVTGQTMGGEGMERRENRQKPWHIQHIAEKTHNTCQSINMEFFHGNFSNVHICFCVKYPWQYNKHHVFFGVFLCLDVYFSICSLHFWMEFLLKFKRKYHGINTENYNATMRGCVKI